MKICLRLLYISFTLFQIKGMAQSPVNSQLDTILVTANKLNQNRKEAPIAISILSATTLKKENVTRIDFLLNVTNVLSFLTAREPLLKSRTLFEYFLTVMHLATQHLISNLKSKL